MKTKRPLQHGTVHGFRSHGCRCDGCRLAFAAHTKRYYAASGQRERRGGRRPQMKDRADVATPMQSCDCSLAGVNPPWQWTWDRANSFLPFSEMKQIPFAGDEFWGLRRSR